MAERSQDGRTPFPAPQPWQLVAACPIRAPLRLCLTYRLSLHCALVVAMPWVTPRAVAATAEQLRASANCGPRSKAVIALITKAATRNLFMALSSLHGAVLDSAGPPQPADFKSDGRFSIFASISLASGL